MKRFRLLICCLIVLPVLNPVYAGTYKDALKKWQNESRPWFIAEQVNQDNPSRIAGLPQAVTLPETIPLLHAYQEDRAQGIGRILEEIDKRLAEPVSVQLQKLAVTPKIDDLLRKPISLDVLLNIAYARNPAIRSASQAWLASLNRYPQAAYLDGILRQYNSFTKTLNLLLSGMQKQRQMMDSEFPFPGVASLRGDIVHTDVRMAELDYAITIRNVLADVKKAFHEYVFIGKAVSITQDNQELLEQMLQVASRKFEAGNASYNDVIKARIELSKISNEWITRTGQQETIAAGINTLIDRNPTAALGQPVESEITNSPLDLETLYSLAKQYRQEIRQARLKEKRARLMIALSEKMNRPDPTFGASYFQDRSALLVGSIQEKPAFNPNPRLPLRPWFGQRESFIAEMRNRQQEQNEKVEDITNRTLALVKAMHFSLDSAEREYELYRTTLIPEARQSLEVSEKDYEGARIDFLDYQDAQRRWLEFNLAAYRSLRDKEITRAELERTIGISLTSHTTEKK